MINKGAERAEVPQGQFACLGKDGNLWVDGDRVILTTGEWMEMVSQGLKHFMMAEMLESVEDFAGNQLKQTESLVIIFKSLLRIQKYQRIGEGQI